MRNTIDPIKKANFIARNVLIILVVIFAIASCFIFYNKRSIQMSSLVVNSKKVVQIKYSNKFEASTFYSQQVGDKIIDGSIHTRKKCFQFPNPDCQYNTVVTVDLYSSSNSYFAANKESFEQKNKFKLNETQIGAYRGYYYIESGSDKIGVIFTKNYMVTLQWLNPVYSHMGITQDDINTIINSLQVE